MTEQNGYHLKSNGDHQDEYLFDPNILQSLFKDYSLKDSKLHENNYDEKYLLRPLRISDYDHSYIDLLRQLTECGPMTYEDFKRRFNQMKQCFNTYYILVIEDINTDQQIVGTATLICEKKFIRQLAIRGRIEDVVVHNRCRGQQLGKLLIDLLTQLGRDKCNCYKISLECKDHLVSFYQQFGYNHEDKQNYLCQRFQNSSNNHQENKTVN
jgi:glucosamine-phosphate N-acetyltransferase